MDAAGYAITGLIRPLVLLVFWVPLIALCLWLVRRYAPRHEGWLFAKVPTIGQVIRRLFARARR
jgi:hypothetical protein